MSKKFDIAIMNPPYDRNLHLKILEKVIPHCEETINISPIRWLQDPLAKYKKNSDYNKFKESIAEHIATLKELTTKEAGELFNIGVPFQLGIVKCTNEKQKLFEVKSNKILDKVISQLPNERVKVICSEPKKYDCVVTLISGGKNGGTEAISHWMLSKQKAIYNNGKNENGETYKEYRDKIIWGNLKSKSEVTHYEFDTKEERDNFYDACETTFFRYCFKMSLVDINVKLEFLPIMSDYTQPWTDERFREYFNITDEEWKEIEETMSKYKQHEHS